MKTEMQVLADQQHLLKEMFHLKQNLTMGTELHLQALLQELSRQGQNLVQELKVLQLQDHQHKDQVARNPHSQLQELSKAGLKMIQE
jgi:hypothetical protein